MNSSPPPLPPVISTWQREAMGPVGPGERIETLDVLRGFALLGILLVNISLFSWGIYHDMASAQPWVSHTDALAAWLVRCLAETKFYPLFSFLFGVGVAIQMDRARSSDKAFPSVFVRRLLTLLAIGLAHAFLVWEGDILVLYAVAGFVLLAFQECKPKTPLTWAAVCLAIPVVVYGLIWIVIALASLAPQVGKAIDQEFAKQRTVYQHLFEQNLRIFSRGSIAEIFVQRAKNVVAVWEFTWFFAPTFLAMFLLGLYAGKRRILHDIEANLQSIRRVLVWGLALGLPANVLYAFGATRGNPMDINFASVLTMAAALVGGPALALGYAAALTLLLRRASWNARLQPVAAAGRMALSNYLLQSIVCTTICYSYGLGLYGSLGPAAGLGVAVVIYLAQLIMSAWWVKRFRFGPAEWVWRSATYGRRQPMSL